MFFYTNKSRTGIGSCSRSCKVK